MQLTITIGTTQASYTTGEHLIHITDTEAGDTVLLDEVPYFWPNPAPGPRDEAIHELLTDLLGALDEHMEAGL